MFTYSSWATAGPQLYSMKFRTTMVILKFPLFQVLRRFSAPPRLPAYNTSVVRNGNINQGDFLFSPCTFTSSLFARICLSALNASKLMLCHSVRILTRKIHCVRVQCILLSHTDIDGRVTIKWISKKLCVRSQNGFTCLRLVSSGELCEHRHELPGDIHGWQYPY
jgi:hypothetical protein